MASPDSFNLLRASGFRTGVESGSDVSTYSLRYTDLSLTLISVRAQTVESINAVPKKASTIPGEAVVRDILQVDVPPSTLDSVSRSFARMNVAPTMAKTIPVVKPRKIM